MEKNTAIIILGTATFILFCICGFLGYKWHELDRSQTVIEQKFSDIQQNPHQAIKREFEAKDLYDSAAQTYLNTFNFIDSALKAEAQAKDRLSHESFIQVFEQSYGGFNHAISMAERLLSDYPDTFYREKIAKEGLLIAGNIYPIPTLRQNRDAILQKFMEDRGVSIAFLTKEECKTIDKAISQYAVEKQIPAGTVIYWEEIVPYLRPGSRLAESQGNDLYGNPFALGTINPRGNEVKVSPRTYEKFREAKFDWGPYSPAEP
ncbi:hypothetical protein QPK87_23025 [Kamptonema cortianum]|nr:hypothetical protein [Kamptonema cortianum]MDL5044495.1 hypothetical protein [Oscillatoria amoena NRMC-F 0135]